MKRMDPLKSPRPDGFGACFYQKHWLTVGDDVCAAVLKILKGDGMISSFNSTIIALVPKKCEPQYVMDFRSISLCNVVYKWVSNVMSNRLKPHMHAIISRNQSAFIPGRHITENLMLAHELLHSMRCKRRGRAGKMAIKLDMANAYDRVEWNYLEAAMKALGFNDQWRRLTMSCIQV